MNRDFKGNKLLMESYSYIVENLKKCYMDGLSICFAGMNGTGKSMTATNILKKTAQKNYTSLYSTLSDIVNVLTLSSSEDKFLARRELMMVDFLIVDEFDPKYISSTASSDLFGRTLEHLFRTRSQNKLPTIMCSNSPNPAESFDGLIRDSINSLFHKMKIVPIIGSDFRKEKNKQ